MLGSTYGGEAKSRGAFGLLCGLLLLVFLAGFSHQRALAAELVMFESRSCPWCMAWEREVGGIYDKTPEALSAPLRRVDLDEPRPDDLSGLRAVVYTPTFVLLDEGREVGRIPGYPGADHFWGLLSVLLEKVTRPGE